MGTFGIFRGVRGTTFGPNIKRPGVAFAKRADAENVSVVNGGVEVMPNLSTFLAAVQARLDKATPGPWQTVPVQNEGTKIVASSEKVLLQMHGWGGEELNADLIAHAPSYLAYALRMLAVAQEMAKYLQDSSCPYGHSREVGCERCVILTHWTQVTQEGT